MTHDPEIAKGYDRDPFHFGHITVGWLFAILDSQTKMLDRARDIQGPLFCIVAGDDRVVSKDAAERFTALSDIGRVATTGDRVAKRA